MHPIVKHVTHRNERIKLPLQSATNEQHSRTATMTTFSIIMAENLRNGTGELISTMNEPRLNREKGNRSTVAQLRFRCEQGASRTNRYSNWLNSLINSGVLYMFCRRRRWERGGGVGWWRQSTPITSPSERGNLLRGNLEIGYQFLWE